MVRLFAFVGTLALIAVSAGLTGRADAAARLRHGALRAGQCAKLGDARLCAGDTYWVTLTVAGREIDFNGGGKVADGLPGQSVAYEIEFDGNLYRVKVENWSTADVEFARYSEIRFRKQGQRFQVTGYTEKGFGTDCEAGVDYSGDVDFVSGQQVAEVDGKRLFVGPVIPAKLRTPDLFRFKMDRMYKPYRLYDGLAEATRKYCGNSNG